MSSYGEEKLTYDAIGNPLKYCELTLTWEKGRRLKSASNGSESVTYTYDGTGVRRSKAIGGSKTEYVYERGKLIREIRGSEKIDYLYGEEGIIGIKVGGEKYLYRKNVFGDVTEIYNEAGTLVGKYSYSAFGECEIEQDEGGIAEKNAIRYRGYYYDEETGFYYLKTRYYDPEIGRFITIDDTSYLAPDTINGLNLYAYCGNNPVMRIDENGNAWWHWVIGALVVVSVAFATAVTAGTFALALGISSTVVGTLTSSVALSGILVGGLNLFVQWSSGLEMPNIKALTINTALGGITGALSGGANLLITGTKIAAQLGKQVIVNIAISLGAYMIQSLINKNKLTVEGAVIAIGSGMIAGLTFNQPLISSVVITMAIELAGYAWENIRKIFEG